MIAAGESTENAYGIICDRGHFMTLKWMFAINDNKKMTSELLVGVDRRPSLWAAAVDDRDPDQFSMLDGLGECSPSGDRSTHPMRTLQSGLAGFALAVAAGAALMHSVDHNAANAPTAPSLGAKMQSAQALRPLPATAGPGGVQASEQGSAARIISAEPGQEWSAAVSAAGGRAPSAGAEPARPPSGRASVPPVAPVQGPLIAGLDAPHTGRKATPPGRPAGAVPRTKHGRDRDVDIITAIVENAGRRR